MKFYQKAFIGILVSVVLFVGLFVISNIANRLDEKELLALLRNKTSIILNDEISLKKYNNTGLSISDFAESYTIKLTTNDYDLVKAQGWNEVEKGYQLLVPQKDEGDKVFIFFLDKNHLELNIQIIEE